MEELKHLLQIDLMNKMPINKKNLSRALDELNKKGENLIIEKYEGSFGVSKDFSGLMSVRAIIDLESGKIRTRSSMGLITIIIIAVSILTLYGLILVVALYYFGVKPAYEHEMKKMMKKALRSI
jgi:hypothetical protein